MGAAAIPYVMATIAAYGAVSADANAKASRVAPPKLPPPPQETKQPDQSLARKAGQALIAGPGSTSLTGPGGVPGSSLSLGVNTLLGS